LTKGEAKGTLCGRWKLAERGGRVFVGRHAIEVGWGDCDPARIVFFPRYFEWFEICTTALFRSAGLPLHEMFAERDMVGIPLLDVGARFHFGSAYGHVLDVETRVVEWKTRTFRVEHRFFRDGRLAVEGHELRVWAVPDPTGEKPMRAAPIPQDIVARFMGEDVVSA
jgi:4-hydroxybenzoyl-CoA thioesterase